MFGFIIIIALFSDSEAPNWRAWVAMFWACSMIIACFLSLIFFMTCRMEFELFKAGIETYASQKCEHDPDFLHKFAEQYNAMSDENIYEVTLSSLPPLL